MIAHEFGHFVLFKRHITQAAFGEGFGDATAMLLYNTPIIGEHFYLSGGAVRNPEAANLQYPCSGDIHYCGQVLAGIWWDIKKNFVQRYGQATGLEKTRQLQVDWTLITAGGLWPNSAIPRTAIEVLTMDDDNGFLGDGTPNMNQICSAFHAHGIECPAVVV